jgi:hypothetical protein
MKKYFERINIKYSNIVLYHKILEYNLNYTKGLQEVINNFNQNYSEFDTCSKLLNKSISEF